MASITRSNYKEFYDKFYNSDTHNAASSVKGGKVIDAETWDELGKILETCLIEYLDDTSTGDRYFTKENFKDFLNYLNESHPFADYDETKFNAGLKLIESSIDNDGILQICTPETQTMEQGSYYYSTTPVSGIKFYPYMVKDNKLMGEIMVQFQTVKDEFNAENFEIPDWIQYWFTSNGSLKPSYKSDSNYQIRITTDQDNNFFGYINKYESINTSDITDSSSDETNWIEIEYIVNTSDYKFEAFSKGWVSKNSNSIKKILFAPDGISYSEYTPVNFNNNLTATCNYPRIIIEFKERTLLNVCPNCGNSLEWPLENNICPNCGEYINTIADINLSDMLSYIDFNTFKSKIDASRISSMANMFSASNKNVSANSIDLTGIWNSDNFRADTNDSYMFTGLFQGRKVNDPDGTRLKLFGRDKDGKKIGINTSKALSLANMFNNGPLTNKHCNPIHSNDENDYINGPFNIIRGLNINTCVNFTSMFNGCNVSKFNLKSWTDNINWASRVDQILNMLHENNTIQLNFTNMFSGTGIEDDQLNGINEFIKNISAFNSNSSKNTSVNSYIFTNMFNGCKSIKNASSIDLEHLFEHDDLLHTITMTGMFEECTGLIEGPIFNVSRKNNPNLDSILMERMFKKCGSAIGENSTLSFLNFSKWWFDYPHYESNGSIIKKTAPTISMTSMFEGVPMYKIATSLNSNIFNFCSNDLTRKSSAVDYRSANGIYFARSLNNSNMKDMFKNTGLSNKPYHINFNLDFGSIDEYDQDHINNNRFYNLENILDTTNTGNFNILQSKFDSGDQALFYILQEKMYKNDPNVRNKIRQYS